MSNDDAAVFAGLHHIKIPVSDLVRSRAWYEQVLGYHVQFEFPDAEDGVVRGVAGEVPGLGEVGLALRENPEAARGLAGYDAFAFAIKDKAAAEAWVAKLDRLGVEHSPVIEASIGWIVRCFDPDGIEIRMYSWERLPEDHVGEPGYARPEVEVRAVG
ncbi:VOC family protein [Tenggerimyces flavus]|uniref:VOC family protein n=1 Tax=Tenggerimyces flavus TaxID=1708749 RepID=A0ABV7YAT5_9ACTN|nr:VOC family protein [Tenggerimyces flavus]MBM7783451.1 catechol 2,3-dioxygenase-like lactoylglutathione lyase family enzyme [Tenggerimyces flavus]